MSVDWQTHKQHPALTVGLIVLVLAVVTIAAALVGVALFGDPLEVTTAATERWT